jgi:hypothetical protein
MIYLAQADGPLPNLALMRLGTWLRARGETVRLVRRPEDAAPLLDGRPTHVYGSSIFSFSGKHRAALERALGPITWGGTGVRVDSSLAELDASDWEAIAPDYSLYPAFAPSLGFLTRGCRLRCGFCVVPAKEGRPRVASSVRALWRGEPHPRHLHLLDNDAFAPQLRSHWEDAVAELRAGGFRVCFSQGINLRLIDAASAAAIASVRYCGGDFERRRLYTAWDSISDESLFRRGVDELARAGIPASHLRVYMLTGYDPRETWEVIFYRFCELVSLGCEPFPMVFDRNARPDLLAFQRYAVRHLYRTFAFPEYGAHGHADTRMTPAVRATVTDAWKRVAAGWTPPRRLEVA